MGNNQPAARSHFEEEFNKQVVLRPRASSSETPYLVLDQIIQIQPMKNYPVDFTHLGTLFALDKNKTGKVTLQDFDDLIQLCAEREAKFKQHDFQNQIQAFFTLRMWLEVSKPNAEPDIFVKWFCRLFMENSSSATPKSSKSSAKEPRKNAQEQQQLCCTSESIELMHQLLNIKTSYGINSQSFFDLMRCFAEEQSLYKGRTKANPNLVPIEVVQDFASHFVRGFVDLMLELGFEPNMSLD